MIRVLEKINPMTFLNKKQFEYEYNAWARKIEYFTQENALLKYRLSEMVDDNEEKKFLQIAEFFQNELLLQDDLLKKLIKELKGFQNLLSGFQGEKKISDNLVTNHDKLRKNILQFENKFLAFSNEFNQKMLEHSDH